MRRERDAGEPLTRQVIGVGRSGAIGTRACDTGQCQQVAMRTVVHMRGVNRRLRRQLLVITGQVTDVSGSATNTLRPAMAYPGLLGHRRVGIVRIRQQLFHRCKQNAEHDEHRGKCATKSESDSLRMGHDVATRCKKLCGTIEWSGQLVAHWTLTMVAFAR